MNNAPLPHFCDLPNEYRMKVRGIVEDHGGHVEGYFGGYLLVALARKRWVAMEADLAEAGIVPAENGRSYFPLGTDKPPGNLRWDGNYPGSKGFWCYCHYVVVT